MARASMYRICCCLSSVDVRIDPDRGGKPHNQMPLLLLIRWLIACIVRGRDGWIRALVRPVSMLCLSS